ncbi:MAG: tetratricopeptide repeat protein [Gemmatimonadales bacterium]|nr:tetratricopeptide repeat protein [Gemmatimonadales bacterium]NIN13506.1 tetratricopeptide repeat protein [Gemmatimonadales bacterium]NIN51500.1 tetratricopeptide repeat protein [Gemmatimonadales bacterium]NIP08964.1 tetratricopeptide repeat protein [Gemmatimonadales bacterium]NIR03742.1 tetratricopeptide repeat protein [Gemmatimonadales bacterium]
MRPNASRVILVWCLALAACVGAAADHETLADRAYGERRYGEALVEYRLALVRRAPDAALRAKAGAAALHSGQLLSAAEEYTALGREGGEERRGEAADGLARVASAAVEDGDQEALAAALAGLQEVAPGRALGSFAQQLAGALGTAPRSREALTVLTYAAASAPDARTLDSLIYLYGIALRRRGRCEDAIPALESLVRRQREPAVTEDAQRQAVLCALSLGRRARDRGSPSVAEEWFRRAVALGGDSPGARAAYVGLGDLRFGLGDFLEAIEAYEQARAGLLPGDSLYEMVAERLNRIPQAERRFR